VPDPGNGIQLEKDELRQFYGLQQSLDLVWVPIKSFFRGYDYGIAVIQQFKEWRGDILYTRLPQAAAFGSTLNIPTIFEVHDLPGSVMSPWLFRRFLDGKGAQRLVLITKALKKALNRQFGPLPKSPFTLIAPDGVDLVRYENLPESQEARESLQKNYGVQIRKDQFTAGYTGQLYPGRGMDHIFTIASRVPDINFLLVGGNPEDISELHTRIIKNSLDNVILTGFVQNQDLVSYQASCDVLLMPYQEVVAASSGGDIANYLSPMKMFEYLACGRVILSSDLPVLREVLTEKNALLLSPTDVNAWVKTLLDMREDPEKRKSIGACAKETALKYTWEARAKQIFSFDA
jgi:glycosyltransferase involved in cell wall biosynthesis